MFFGFKHSTNRSISPTVLPDDRQIRKARRVPWAQHIAFHLPLLLDSLSGEIQRAFSIFGI
jgi:hypothetical protein